MIMQLIYNLQSEETCGSFAFFFFAGGTLPKLLSSDKENKQTLLTQPDFHNPGQSLP